MCESWQPCIIHQSAFMLMVENGLCFHHGSNHQWANRNNFSKSVISQEYSCRSNCVVLTRDQCKWHCCVHVLFGLCRSDVLPTTLMHPNPKNVFPYLSTSTCWGGLLDIQSLSTGWWMAFEMCDGFVDSLTSETTPTSQKVSSTAVHKTMRRFKKARTSKQEYTEFKECECWQLL